MAEQFADSVAQAEDNLKRPACDTGFDIPSSSAHRLRGGSGPDAENAWSCPKCGNFNYGGRLFCNMRTCNTAMPSETARAVQHGGDGLVSMLFPDGQQPQGFGGISAFQRTGMEGFGQEFQGAGLPGLQGIPQQPTGLAGFTAFEQQAAQQAAQVAYHAQTAAFDSQAGVAGGWACPSCGNHNDSAQLFCDSKSCGLAKPGLRAADVLGGLGQAMTAPVSMPVPAAPVSSAFGPLGTLGGALASVDPYSLSGYGGFQQTQMEMHMQMFGYHQMALAGLPGGAGAGQAREECGDFKRGVCTRGASCKYSHGITGRVDTSGFGGGCALDGSSTDDKNPPGSWSCSQCGNVNWPTRSTCNGKRGGALCALAREQCEGPREGAKNGPPPGSWLCASCGNVNWPIRTTCNGKNCSRTRDEVDGGAPIPPMVIATPTMALPVPPPSHLSQLPAQLPCAPDGAWICHVCQNVNWPTRTHCNRRTCGAQRMA